MCLLNTVCAQCKIIMIENKVIHVLWSCLKVSKSTTFASWQLEYVLDELDKQQKMDGWMEIPT